MWISFINGPLDSALPHGQDTWEIRLLRHTPQQLHRDRELHHPALRQESHSAATEGEISSTLKLVGNRQGFERLYLIRCFILQWIGPANKCVFFDELLYPPPKLSPSALGCIKVIFHDSVLRAMALLVNVASTILIPAHSKLSESEHLFIIALS